MMSGWDEVMGGLNEEMGGEKTTMMVQHASTWM